MEVKVLNGKTRNKKIDTQITFDSIDLIDKNYHHTHIEIEDKHPSEICEDVDNIITRCKEKQYDKIFMFTNCDHVFNRLRVLKRKGVIKNLEFIYYEFVNSEIKKTVITVDDKGECSEYPIGFLDEWPYQMGQLG